MVIDMQLALSLNNALTVLAILTMSILFIAGHQYKMQK